MSTHLHDTSEDLLLQGRILPVMEEFYTIQGEGFYTGHAAYFVRIGGCDVGCNWCDVKESWNAGLYHPIPVDPLVERAASCPAKAVVATGGEPMLYNLDYFCRKLKERGIRTFLETSGSQPLSGEWNWICLSPKRAQFPLPGALTSASELKVIIRDGTDFGWAEECAAQINESCLLFLQPEWSRRNTMIPAIVRYCMDHPHWRISLQSHKYMHIP